MSLIKTDTLINSLQLTPEHLDDRWYKKYTQICKKINNGEISPEEIPDYDKDMIVLFKKMHKVENLGNEEEIEKYMEQARKRARQYNNDGE